MTRTITKITNWATTAAAIALTAIVLAGCGTDSAGGVQPTNGPTTTPGNAYEEVDLDGSGSTRSPDLRRRYVAATMARVDQVLANGGHLTIVVFAGSGVASTTLIDEDIPSPEDQSPVANGTMVKQVRGEVEAAVSAAEGLRPISILSPDAQRALNAMSASGSDISGAIEAAVRRAKSSPLTSRHVLTLTDGLYEADFVLGPALHDPAARDVAVRKLAKRIGTAKGVTLAIHGLGLTNNPDNSTAARADALTALWTAVCKRTHADDCDITPEV